MITLYIFFIEDFRIKLDKISQVNHNIQKQTSSSH